MSDLSKEELQRYQHNVKLLSTTEDYVTDLPVSMVTVRHNVRRELNLDEGFIESIRVHGVLQPIVVTVVEDDLRRRMVVCIAGHRRLAATKLVGRPLIKCLAKKLEGSAALQAALSENVNRSPLHPLDLAQTFTELALLGTRRADMEAMFDRDRKTIGRYMKMATWSDHTQEVIRKHPDRFPVRFLMALASRRLTPDAVETLVFERAQKEPHRAPPGKPSAKSIANSVETYFSERGLNEREQEIVVDALRYLKLLR